MDTTTIKLGGEDLTIRMPRSYAVRTDVTEAIALERNHARICGAIMGLCWDSQAFALALNRRSTADEITQSEALALIKRFGPPAAEYKAHEYDVMAYGGAVYDELRERGFTDADIQLAGFAAWRFVNGMPAYENGETPDPTPISSEVEALEDFTGASEEPPTS